MRRAYVLQAFATSPLIVMPSLKKGFPKPILFDICAYYEFLVSKETVVLRRRGRSKQKFGFIKRVDKGWITTVKDLES